MENQPKQYPATVFLSVFPVKDKKNEKSPDYRISAKIGTEFKDAGCGWKKVTERGTYLSLSLNVDIAKQLITEKMATLQSNGRPIPFTDEPKDPVIEFDNF